MTNKSKVFSADEERALVILAQGGDIEARNRLVESWMDYVHRIARNLPFSGMCVEDVAQEGVFGLIRAIRNFDPDKGFRFSTYAKTWVINFMYRAKIDRYTLVRTPMYLYSKYMGKPGIKIHCAESLDAMSDTSSSAGHSRLMAVSEQRNRFNEIDDQDEQDKQLENMAGAVAMLDTFEQQVISLRFGINGQKSKSRAATAALIGTGTTKVRNTEKRAMAKLRKAMRA